MVLNNFEFSPSQVAALYRSVLVDINEGRIIQDPVPPALAVVSPKNILVVFRNDQSVALPGNELKFLTEILAACNFTIDDVGIINMSQANGESYKEFISGYKNRYVLLFGVDPASFGLPMSFPPFQTQSFTGVMYLHAVPFSELMNDKLLKTKLWVTLKKIFGL